VQAELFPDISIGDAPSTTEAPGAAAPVAGAPAATAAPPARAGGGRS
jgi:hypothetical protein